MRLQVLLGLAAAVLTPGLAAAFDTPTALVAAIYEPYQNGRQHADLQQFYSERLKGLFAEHAAGAVGPIEAAAGEPAVSPALDFNPFIDGQNASLLSVLIGDPVVVGKQALVTVGFANFSTPTLLSLSLVKEDGGWRVDDISSMGGEENWMLSWVLQYDPWSL